MKTQQNIEMKPEMSQELCFKIMRIGQFVLELEDKYMQNLSRDMQVRLKSIIWLLKDIAEDLPEHVQERMEKWEEDITRGNVGQKE